MKLSANQNMILIEGTATYERILADVREVEADEGVRHINDFIKIYPDFAPAHNDLAVMYYQTGNSLKALAHYEKAHKLDPANVTYRKNLADFYYVELDWTGDAINTYLDILKDNPFDIEALNALGTISLQIGRKEQARQFFTRTLQLDANNHEAQSGLQQLPVPLASPEIQRSIPQMATPAVRPPEIPVSAPAAESFQNLFRTVQPEPAKSSDELYREAITFANADKISDAIQLLEQLVTKDTQNAVAHNDLGVLLQKSGNPRKSRVHHEEAVRLQPANKIFQKNLADLLFIEFDECEKALEIYVRLLAKAPRDIEILKAIAHVCMELGKPDDTRFFLERVLGFQPWDKDALKLLQLMEEVALTKENK
ncbi:MAG: tetratricopeptide repeat protein [Desulfuromonadaceae bacterium]|nr:tetratricopeptide repeat protein [Desulfuromonadaceae bacterium]